MTEKKVEAKVTRKHLSDEEIKKLLKGDTIVKVCHSEKESLDYMLKICGLK